MNYFIWISYYAEISSTWNIAKTLCGTSKKEEFGPPWLSQGCVFIFHGVCTRVLDRKTTNILNIPRFTNFYTTFFNRLLLTNFGWICGLWPLSDWFLIQARDLLLNTGQLTGNSKDLVRFVWDWFILLVSIIDILFAN